MWLTERGQRNVGNIPSFPYFSKIKANGDPNGILDPVDLEFREVSFQKSGELEGRL